MNREICGECKYHHRDEYHKEDWTCVNGESDYAAEYTDYTDSCDCFEQRGIETVDLRKETVREEDWEW